jgi:hypothetical protein
LKGSKIERREGGGLRTSKRVSTWVIVNSFFFPSCYWSLNSGSTPWVTPPALLRDSFFFNMGLTNYLPRLA